MDPNYQSNIDLHQAATLLRAADRIVVTTHAKPDGDAFGSVVALGEVLRDCGHAVTCLFMPPMPRGIQTIAGDLPLAFFESGQTLPEADLYVLADTGAWSQIQPLKTSLLPHMDKTLIIDHHLNGDVQAAYRLVDGKAAACCELMASLVQLLKPGCFEDSRVTQALYLGIATDTGWFRFSNTRPQTHQLAARLIDAGVNHTALFEQAEQAERPEKLKLMIRALDSLELLADQQAALMILTSDDFIQTGALPEETERFVDLPQIVATVQVVVLVSQSPGEGPIRISFRSKPTPHAVNVARLAQRFGGGGHARAAGAKMDRPLEEVVRQIRRVLVDEIVF